jgi:hypothetical protein
MELRTERILLGSLVALGGWFWWDGRAVHRPEGVLAAEDPRQAEPSGEDRPFEFKGYRLIPLAKYAVKARVLSRERYWVEGGAALAPVDLALGWGPMSDSKVLSAFSISQSGRWYHWSADTLPISAQEVVSHSANTHIIPADVLVRRAVLDFKEGDVVELEGYLVRVEGPGGFRWVSSLSRTDAGDGSCELMYVKEARREPR